jgi:spermidine synthase
MILNADWFTEICKEDGTAFSLKLKEKVHDEQTPYQRIEIFETEAFGTLMTLDGLVMLTDRDNFIYHEMLAHPALFTHPNPRRILIIGGGDCGTLFEVLKHPSVDLAEQVEIDERVTRVSEKFFPELCNSNRDPRASLVFTDGIRWVAESESGHYDVIIIDSTDPVGPAAGLFSEDFYKSCFRALAPQGVVAGQSESPLFHLKLIQSMHQAMHAAGFQDAATLHFPQCSYPSGWWSVTLGCKSAPAHVFREQDVAQKTLLNRYYNLEMHRAALTPPEFLRLALKRT